VRDEATQCASAVHVLSGVQDEHDGNAQRDDDEAELTFAMSTIGLGFMSWSRRWSRCRQVWRRGGLRAKVDQLPTGARRQPRAMPAATGDGAAIGPRRRTTATTSLPSAQMASPGAEPVGWAAFTSGSAT
jgi:hypothetical protein